MRTPHLLRYASGMTSKRKVSVSLDDDLVEELEAGDEALSAQVNAALRNELDRRRQHRLLGELLDGMDKAHGPVKERLVERYVELLG